MGFFSKVKEAVGIAVGRTYDSGLQSTLRYPALENSAFWACIVGLSRTFATLPLHVYVQRGRNTMDDRSSRLALVLKNPCPYMTSYMWRFVMAFNYELFGKAMAIIERDARGEIVALLPVSPNMMMPEWNDSRLYYRYNGTKMISADDVLVISSTPVGITGVLSTAEYASADITVAKNSQKLQDNFFRQGTTLGGILTVPRNTPAATKKALRDLIQGEYSGSANAYKTMIIEDSMKYEAIRLGEKDTASMMDAQKWSIAEVARRFGVPASFVGDRSSNGTYSSIEQENLQLVTMAIQPRAISWEEALNTLCNPDQYVKINLKGMMRADHLARSTFYHNAIMDGWMSINDVRSLEDLNPIKGGDQYFFPMNYTTIDKVGKYGESVIPPTPAKLDEAKKRYTESVLSEARSSRRQIEAVMRRHLKMAIEYLNSISGGDVASIFRKWCEEQEEVWGAEYEPVYEGLIKALEPTIRKYTKSDAKISADSIKAYATKLANGTAGRFGANRSKDVDDALEDGDDLEDLEADWVENVPSSEAHEESQRSTNAFSVFLMDQMGIEKMVVSVEADCCDFCAQLDGKVVSVNGTILAKGSDIEDGAGNVIHIHKNLKHPPFHRSCECVVVPER